jgi:hypothetical protein
VAAVAGRLDAEVRADRQTLEDARVALTRAQQLDREALARQMRTGSGEEAVSTTQVEQAEADVRSAERTLSGRLLAREDASAELGVAVGACRDEWLRTAQRTLAKALTRTERTRAQLVSDVAALGEAAALVYWLTPGRGLDQGLPVGSVNLAAAKSSAFSQANSEPVGVPQLLDWLGEAIQRTRELSVAEPVPAAAE